MEWHKMSVSELAYRQHYVSYQSMDPHSNHSILEELNHDVHATIQHNPSYR